MLGLKIFVWVQTFWQRPFAQLLPPCVMYFLLLKCVFLHFPIVFVVFQIYVWCTFNMYFLFYQYVFVVFPTIFAFPLYLHLFCCSSKIYFTFSTWFFVFTISICVYIFFTYPVCVCAAPQRVWKELQGGRGGLSPEPPKKSHSHNGGLKRAFLTGENPICDCKSCKYFLTPTKSHFQAWTRIIHGQWHIQWHEYVN